MAIPELDQHGVLPPGIHGCSMVELLERFGTTKHRQNLIASLKKVLVIVRKDLAQPIYIDGGFVTASTRPADIDVVIDMLNAPEADRTKAFRLMLEHRGRWYTRWKVDFMPELPANGEKFIDSFQKVGPNTATRLGLIPDHPKGILLLTS